jgi:DNA-binding NtrC family response regulator
MPIEFRVIAAANCEPESLVAEGKFRKDLFFRLNVARFRLPPLRERKEDIIALANFFREILNPKFGMTTAGFTPLAEQALLGHDWPGNIRELRNVIEAAFINLEPDTKMVDLPISFCQALTQNQRMGLSERDRMLIALSETHWNKSRAAAKMHWSRMTLYRKMAKYQVLPIPAQLNSRAE